MRFLVTEKLGPHKFKTPEGYLICTDAILSRTGKQEYKRCELFGDACEDPDKIVNVERTDDEVFDDKAMASFENKAVCVEHPDHDVNVENHNDLSVGFVRDIHKGEDNGKPVMMGTLVITDKDAVEAVESGEYKELSCGYDCDIDDDGEPRQRNIRGNHVALCKQGRAGIARIVDSVAQTAVIFTDDAKLKYEKLKREREELEEEINRNDNNAYYNLRETHKRMEEIDKEMEKLRKNSTSLNDARLSAKERNEISSYLSNISNFTKNDPDIIDLISPLERKGYKVFRKNIKGWYKTSDGTMRKDYFFGINGYDNTFMISLYADNGEWKVNEVNAYLIDSTNISLNKEKEMKTDSTKDSIYSELQRQVKQLTDRLRIKTSLGVAVDQKTKEVMLFAYSTEQANRWIDKLRAANYKANLHREPGNVHVAKFIMPELKTDSTKDSIYTVEYVKDNITYIRKIKATSLEDAILKAKDDIHKDANVAQLNKQEEKLAILLGKITDYIKVNGPLTAKELATHFKLSTSDMQSHLSQLCTNIGGVKQIRAGKDFKYIADSTKDSIYTVEYVKDNITYIRKIKATSLEDAILKAKDEIKDTTSKVKDGRNIYLSSGEKLNTDTAIVEYKRKKCKVHEASSDGTNINISSIGPGIWHKWVNIKEVKILKH